MNMRPDQEHQAFRTAKSRFAKHALSKHFVFVDTPEVPEDDGMTDPGTADRPGAKVSNREESKRGIDTSSLGE